MQSQARTSSSETAILIGGNQADKNHLALALEPAGVELVNQQALASNFMQAILEQDPDLLLMLLPASDCMQHLALDQLARLGRIKGFPTLCFLSATPTPEFVRRIWIAGVDVCIDYNYPAHALKAAELMGYINCAQRHFYQSELQQRSL